MPKVVSNIKSVDRIITAKDYGESARGYINIHRAKIERSKGLRIVINERVSKHSVKARIEQGQWIADCECGGASFVDYDEPVFFCFSCGNRADDNRLREVEFPPESERLTIEKLLLDRPVDDRAGLNDRERVGLARPIIFVEGRGGLARNWNPNETVLDLMEQNKAVDEWKKSLKGGK